MRSSNSLPVNTVVLLIRPDVPVDTMVDSYQGGAIAGLATDTEVATIAYVPEGPMITVDLFKLPLEDDQRGW